MMQGKVTRCEERPSTFMTPLMDGGYAEHTAEQAHAWRCDGCGLVWEKRWHAETCTKRGHKTSFVQGPYGVRGVENGKLIGTPTYYTRRAIRREQVQGQKGE
jgi:hypothetical protein